MATAIVVPHRELIGASRWGTSAGLLVHVSLGPWGRRTQEELASALVEKIPELRRVQSLRRRPSLLVALGLLADAMLEAIGLLKTKATHGQLDGPLGGPTGDGAAPAWLHLPAPRMDIAYQVARGLEAILQTLPSSPTRVIEHTLAAMLESWPASDEMTQLAEAAERLGVPARFLGEGPRTLLLGFGGRRRVVHETGFHDAAGLQTIVADKLITARWLAQNGIPCSRPTPVRSAHQAVQAARQIGYPVVVKPSRAARQLGVSTGVRTDGDLARAFRRARPYVDLFGGDVSIEQHHAGRYVRATVVGGSIAAIVTSTAPRIRGDGSRTAEQLAAQAYELPPRGKFDERSRGILVSVLAAQRLDLHSVPTARRWVVVGLSNHGRFSDITSQAHPSLRRVILQVARLFPLPVIGIDLLVGDPTRALDCARDVVLEVNARPAFLLGSPRCDVAEKIVSHFFPRGARDATVPVVICGPGGGRTLMSLSRLLGRAGIATSGYACGRLWSGSTSLVQIMDPAIGRHWMTETRFLQDLYSHELLLPAAAWREWAGNEDSLGLVRHHLAGLNVARADRDRLVDAALADSGPSCWAALDAAVRMTGVLARTQAVRPGREAARAIETLAAAERSSPGVLGPSSLVQPVEAEQVRVRGVVLVRARGLRQGDAAGEGARPALSRELVAALAEPRSRPGLELIKLLGADGVFAPSALIVAMAVAAGMTTFESLLWRSLFDVGRHLGSDVARLGAAGALLIFLATVLVIEWVIADATLWFGRRLEARLRVSFLAKIPRLGDRYFHSRLMSDMAERSHSVRALRYLPQLGGLVLRSGLAIVFTCAGLAWLDPAQWWAAVLLGLFAVGAPFAAASSMTERDLRFRVHEGALARFYLDALLGVMPMRAHRAAGPMRESHESLLFEWSRAGLRVLRTAVVVEALQLVGGFALAAWLVATHLYRHGADGGVLLIAYWALQLPILGGSLAHAVRELIVQRNFALRLVEPLGAPEDALPIPTSGPVASGPVAVRLDSVTVRAAGHLILDTVSVDIPAGSHVAIVGESGTGKSSLFGLLLGWHRAAEGCVYVDDTPLEQLGLSTLRPGTVWVDPSVQIWNRSVVANLAYGNGPGAAARVGAAVDAGELRELVAKMGDGLQTSLGEGGALVSGGEGQRVRFARAWLRPDARLVLLDEPFRGLDRARRRAFLERARAFWRGATLLCVTHDIGETASFERVLVVDGGRIVEDGAPAELAGRPGSRYGALIEAEHAVRARMEGNAVWRRVRLDNGRVVEDGRGG